MDFPAAATLVLIVHGRIEAVVMTCDADFWSVVMPSVTCIVLTSCSLYAKAEISFIVSVPVDGSGQGQYNRNYRLITNPCVKVYLH